MSGSPRSRRTTSGALEADAAMAPLPVLSLRWRNPCVSRAVRMGFLIVGSSSTTRIVGLDSVGIFLGSFRELIAWQRELERASVGDGVPNDDATPMCLHNRLAKGETKPDASLGVRERSADCIEGFEDMRLIAIFNAGAIIFNPDNGLGASRAR